MPVASKPLWLVENEGPLRNAHLKIVGIHLDDTGAVRTAEIGSGHGPYRISVVPDPTTSLSSYVVASVPGWHYQGREPFDEPILPEVTVFGIELPDDPTI